MRERPINKVCSETNRKFNTTCNKKLCGTLMILKKNILKCIFISKTPINRNHSKGLHENIQKPPCWTVLPYAVYENSFYNFYDLPHLNSKFFTKRSKSTIKKHFMWLQVYCWRFQRCTNSVGLNAM